MIPPAARALAAARAAVAAALGALEDDDVTAAARQALAAALAADPGCADARWLRVRLALRLAGRSGEAAAVAGPASSWTDSAAGACAQALADLEVLAAATPSPTRALLLKPVVAARRLRLHPAPSHAETRRCVAAALKAMCALSGGGAVPSSREQTRELLSLFKALVTLPPSTRAGIAAEHADILKRILCGSCTRDRIENECVGDEDNLHANSVSDAASAAILACLDGPADISRVASWVWKYLASVAQQCRVLRPEWLKQAVRIIRVFIATSPSTSLPLDSALVLSLELRHAVSVLTLDHCADVDDVVAEFSRAVDRFFPPGSAERQDHTVSLNFVKALAGDRCIASHIANTSPLTTSTIAEIRPLVIETFGLWRSVCSFMADQNSRHDVGQWDHADRALHAHLALVTYLHTFTTSFLSPSIATASAPPFAHPRSFSTTQKLLTNSRSAIALLAPSLDTRNRLSKCLSSALINQYDMGVAALHEHVANLSTSVSNSATSASSQSPQASPSSSYFSAVAAVLLGQQRFPTPTLSAPARLRAHASNRLTLLAARFVTRITQASVSSDTSATALPFVARLTLAYPLSFSPTVPEAAAHHALASYWTMDADETPAMTDFLAGQTASVYPEHKGALAEMGVWLLGKYLVHQASLLRDDVISGPTVLSSSSKSPPEEDTPSLSAVENVVTCLLGDTTTAHNAAERWGVFSDKLDDALALGVDNDSVYGTMNMLPVAWLPDFTVDKRAPPSSLRKVASVPSMRAVTPSEDDSQSFFSASRRNSLLGVKPNPPSKNEQDAEQEQTATSTTATTQRRVHRVSSSGMLGRAPIGVRAMRSSKAGRTQPSPNTSSVQRRQTVSSSLVGADDDAPPSVSLADISINTNDLHASSVFDVDESIQSDDKHDVSSRAHPQTPSSQTILSALKRPRALGVFSSSGTRTRISRALASGAGHDTSNIPAPTAGTSSVKSPERRRRKGRPGLQDAVDSDEIRHEDTESHDFTDSRLHRQMRALSTLASGKASLVASPAPRTASTPGVAPRRGKDRMEDPQLAALSSLALDIQSVLGRITSAEDAHDDEEAAETSEHSPQEVELKMEDLDVSDDQQRTAANSSRAVLHAANRDAKLPFFIKPVTKRHYPDRSENAAALANTSAALSASADGQPDMSMEHIDDRLAREVLEGILSAERDAKRSRLERQLGMLKSLYAN